MNTGERPSYVIMALQELQEDQVNGQVPPPTDEGN